MTRAIDAACRALLDHEAHLTQLDQVVGDGDLGTAGPWPPERGSLTPSRVCGTTAAWAVRAGTQSDRRDVGTALRRRLLRTSEALAAGAAWPDAFAAGGSAITDLGGATVGDRTMVDALAPAAAAAVHGLDAAVEAARLGADLTGEQVARRGRSSYLGERVRGHPDPGAVAVTVWLSALTRRHRGR